MKVWATIIISVLGVVPVVGDPSSVREVSLSDAIRVVADDAGLHLMVTVHEGDAWSRLSRRITGDGANWRAIAERNGRGDSLWAGDEVLVPWRLVRSELRAMALSRIFPEGGRAEGGWIHEVVLDRNGEGESLWEIARWYTGSGANYRALIAASNGRPLSTRIGERVMIPSELLIPELRSKAVDSSVTPARSRGGMLTADREQDSLLEYSTESGDRIASYALKEGEAIYSSVAIRFTGRVHADDVNEAVRRIVEFNGIEDVARLPVGYEVRIPLDMLTDQYLPLDDPRRQAWEAGRLVAGTNEVRALRLEGVHVVIDPGHGGRDVGASFGDVWESNYVYDIARRLRDELESRSAATVWMTTESRLQESDQDLDAVQGAMDHVLRTEPVYDLSSPTVGVNLRWYLANSILSRLESRGVPRDRIIFLSLHADSLHPSLKGAMAYIPGRNYVEGRYEKRERVYLARREVRENPVSVVTAGDAEEAEARSHALASVILQQMREEGLAVHPYTSIRDHVVRKGREWVPAVIRHNQIPSRVLLEVGNLGNPEDRSLLQTRRWRASVARAIFEGISAHFSSTSEPEPRSLRVAAR